jgi:hypothetical protein
MVAMPAPKASLRPAPVYTSQPKVLIIAATHLERNKGNCIGE